ncbi:hypothetical protein [Shewanella sp.]|uniref:hypothetical protein n=1 Tax=Shewanella sp. TaxID=50422 RepID=UPI0040480095
MDDENAVYMPKSPRERDANLLFIIECLRDEKPLNNMMSRVLIRVLEEVMQHNSVAPPSRQILGFPVKRTENSKQAHQLKSIYALSELFKHEALHLPSDSTEVPCCPQLAMIEKRKLSRYRQIVEAKMKQSRYFKGVIEREIEWWHSKSDNEKIWELRSWYFRGVIDFGDPQIRQYLK